MVTSFKTKFEDGTPTFFIESIYKSVRDCGLSDNIEIPEDMAHIVSLVTNQPTLHKPKRHTIRKGNRFKEGDLIHMATGVRTKNYKCFLIIPVVSVQQIEIKVTKSDVWKIHIDGADLFTYTRLVDLAHNDGLSIERFIEWFHKAGEKDADGMSTFKGQIVHWTNLLYN